MWKLTVSPTFRCNNLSPSSWSKWQQFITLLILSATIHLHMVSYPRKGSISQKGDALGVQSLYDFWLRKTISTLILAFLREHNMSLQMCFEVFCQQPLLNSYVKSVTSSNISVKWTKRWHFWRLKFYISIWQHVVTLSNRLK